MNAQARHPLEDQIADFINGHLNPTEQQHFESTLAHDSALQELVQLERAIQHTVRSQPNVAMRAPSFEKLEERITKPWLKWLVPSAVAAVLVFSMTTLVDTGQVVTEDYETLTDSEVRYEAEAYRISLAGQLDAVEFQRFLNTHHLEVLKKYPPTTVVDVAITKDTRVNLLVNDVRVQSLQAL